MSLDDTDPSPKIPEHLRDLIQQLVKHGLLTRSALSLKAAVQMMDVEGVPARIIIDIPAEVGAKPEIRTTINHDSLAVD